MTLIATIGENETLGCQSVHWLKQKKAKQKSKTKIQLQNNICFKVTASWKKKVKYAGFAT